MRGGGAKRLGAVVQGGGVDDLEVGAVQLLKLVQVVVVPAGGRGAGHVPGRAVVGQDHAVLLQGREDDPRLRTEVARCRREALSRTRRPMGGSDERVVADA